MSLVGGPQWVTTPRMWPLNRLTAPPSAGSIELSSPYQPESLAGWVRCAQTFSIGPGSVRSKRTALTFRNSPFLSISVFLQLRFESVEPARPELAYVANPIGDRVDPGWIELVDPSLRLGAHLHQPRRPQGLQVLRDGRRG